MFMSDFSKLFCIINKTIFLILMFFQISTSTLSVDNYTKEEYFDIARSITQKKGGKELILKNIMRDHTGNNPSKSAFYSDDINQISLMIDEIVNNPSYYDFSKSSGNLMIIKDFEPEEIKKIFQNQNHIGFHRTPNQVKIESNRVTLFFGHQNVISQGKPWDGTKGVLLTGMPDNPGRKY